MKEFTFEQYKKIVTNFRECGYALQKVKDFISSPINKSVVLRHDVDRYPGQALQMAKIENRLGIKSTYYFLTRLSVLKKEVIKDIVSMGHEIGYHYDDLAAANGNSEKALELFKRNLENLRGYYPVVTICAHGNPISPWNNTNLWKIYDYREFGVKADLLLDIDYNKVFYLTDNGFGWNKFNVSVRDKVITYRNISIRDTGHLIKMTREGLIPQQILLNTHPDTFFDPGIRWYLNRLIIKLKNPIKWLIVKTGIFN